MPPKVGARSPAGAAAALPGLKCDLTNVSYSSFGKEPWTICSLDFVRSAILFSFSSFRLGYALRKYIAAWLVCGMGKRLYFESAPERTSSCARAVLALWCNWLTRRPLKAKSPGSSPGNATKINNKINSLKVNAKNRPLAFFRSGGTLVALLPPLCTV
jgi:hypothetical protein